MIQTYLQQKGFNPPKKDFRALQQRWLSWYRGYVGEFHKYSIKGVNGKKAPHQRYQMGMAKVICEDFASLLINEHVQVTCEGFDDLPNILEANDFHTRANRLAELTMAFGSGAFVELLDEKGRPVIDYVRGEMIYPLSWDGDKVIECAFASAKARKGKDTLDYYIQMHLKSPNGWYVKNVWIDEKGAELPTPEGMRPETPASPMPLFQIVRPNTINMADFDCPLGASVYADALDQLKACDIIYDSYVNEFVLGKKRLLVPMSAAKAIATEEGQIQPVFDPNDVLIYVYEGDPNRGDKPIDIDLKIRADEHEKGIQRSVDLLSKKCGLGVGRYRFEGGNVTKTATEVISVKSDLYQSIEKHKKPFRDAIVDMVIALGWLSGKKTNLSPSVAFDDSIIEDVDATIDKNIRLVSAGLRSKKRAVMEIEKLDEAAALKFLDEIRKENTITQEELDRAINNSEFPGGELTDDA